MQQRKQQTNRGCEAQPRAGRLFQASGPQQRLLATREAHGSVAHRFAPLPAQGRRDTIVKRGTQEIAERE